MISLLRYIVGHLRSVVYKMGFRPKYGAILYSPSLALKYEVKDSDAVGAFAKGLEQGESQELKTKRHKHTLQFASVSWRGKIGAHVNEHDKELSFRCLDDCPYSTKNYGLIHPYTLSLPRWRYREMVLTQKPVDQLWPG